MKTGDLVKSKGFGPMGSVGEFGILLDYDSLRGGWWVQFGDREAVVAAEGLKIVRLESCKIVQ